MFQLKRTQPTDSRKTANEIAVTKMDKINCIQKKNNRLRKFLNRFIYKHFANDN